MPRSSSRLAVWTVLGLALALISCDTKCGVADSVSILDQRNGLFLVYRVTGTHDKLEIFELYRGRPEFDSCGASVSQPISSEPYSKADGLLKQVKLSDDRLTLVYTTHLSESVEPQQARLSP